MVEAVKVAATTGADADEWASMRQALWPKAGLAAHAEEIGALLARPGDTIALVARDTQGRAAGFAEASLRHDYVNGCETSPVVFLEGIYVMPDFRRRGVARLLVAAVEAWGLAQGCREFGSDTSPDNAASRMMHVALGFEETQRVVFYRRLIGEAGR